MDASSTPCPDCGHLNLPGKRFCGGCGRGMPSLCAACGAVGLPGDRFCQECGTLLHGQSPPAPTASPSGLSPAPAPVPPPQPAGEGSVHEERRLVTALFCDLAGFTPIAEQLDPEEVRDMQTQYFSAMSAQVERYGGTVEKYAGDAVLALFGAPIAHEDDAERAVLCALEMQEAIEPVAAGARARWEVEPAIRVGVNTGEVVSGTWSTGGRQDVAVTGDAVNAAARIQAAAEPGEILVGVETMRLTRRRIRYGERRELVLKGKMGTVTVYPAVGLREQFGERWETSERATALIGRHRELLDLLDAWVRTQNGEGQVITLVGEAGVGKSRLIAEFLDRIGGGAMRVVRGRCLSYGQEISLWLLADLLRSLGGIREQDGLPEVASKLRGFLAGAIAGATDDQQAEALDVLGEVLGIPPGNSMVAAAGPQIRRQALIRALRLVLDALSERAPTVFVLEDLHWMDEASAELLKEILSDVPGLRVLVLAAQRPGWTAPWSDWGWTERVMLRPLLETDATELASSVLGGARLSRDLERYVADRAGGNPFFVEEMLRALADAGGLIQYEGTASLVPGAADRLPSTLTEVLLARLDRLSGEVRGVAQVASVIGRTFGVRLLAEVLDWDTTSLEGPLQALQQAEIAFPRRSGDREYMFKHVSMREVAYNTLVHKRRQELHLRTARAIARLYPSDEYAEIIAYHYSLTDEHGEAVPWLIKAGDRAVSVYAMDTAIEHFEHALQRMPRAGSPPLECARVDEKLGNALLLKGETNLSLEVLERAAATYRRERDLEGAGRVTAQMGVAHRHQGTPEEGISLVQPAIDLLDWSGPSEALASLHLALAALLFLVGRYDAMREAASRAAEIARALDNPRLLGEAEERQAVSLVMSGKAREGREIIERVLPIIEAGGDLIVYGRALTNLGEAYKVIGEIAASKRCTEQALELAERVGNADVICFVSGNLASILMTEGDWKSARGHLERALALARRKRRVASMLNPLLTLGQLSLWEGDREAAARSFDECLSLCQTADDRQFTEHTHKSLAELDLLEGRIAAGIDRLEPLIEDEHTQKTVLLPTLAHLYLVAGEQTRAAEAIANAVELATGRETIYLVEALVVQAHVLLATDANDEAERVIANGLALTRQMPYPYVEARLLVASSELHSKRGDQRAALEDLTAARRLFERLGASADLAALDATAIPKA